MSKQIIFIEKEQFICNDVVIEDYKKEFVFEVFNHNDKIYYKDYNNCLWNDNMNIIGQIDKNNNVILSGELSVPLL